MFDPAAFGFEAVTNGRGGERFDKCYVLMSNNTKGGKPTGQKAKIALDSGTTEAVFELFGERCNVAIQPETAKVVLYEGKGRKLLFTKNTSRAYISVESETETFVNALGTFRRYEYEAKVWAKGEAILLTPLKRLT